MIVDNNPSDPLCVTLRASADEAWRIEDAPARMWDRQRKCWVMPILPNVPFFKSHLRANEFTDEAVAQIRAAIANRGNKVAWQVSYLGNPMAHQIAALDLAAGKDAFFFAHAMGAGKSLVVLTLTCNLYLHEGLRGLVVVCPASIRRDVWEAEVKKWLPQSRINYSSHVIESGSDAATHKFIRSDDRDLKILIVSVQSLSNANGKAYQAAAEFMTNTKCAMVVDEASRIKNADAKRTANTIELGNLANWRWAATGTKITQGIHDIYSQFRFLDWRILGHKSFYTFRNRYCVLGGFEGKKIIGYRNMPQLLELMKPYVHEIRKEDANQLPPKVYLKRHVDPSPEQKKLYGQLRTDLMAVADGDVLTVKNTLERLVRYAQLAGGNFPYRDDNSKEWHTRSLASNPKLTELLELLDDCDDKVIIWAVFVPEIRSIVTALAKVYGPDSVVAYYGEVDTATRTKNIEKFKYNRDCRFFVANQQTAGMGLTLTEATLAVYFSNSFSLEDRLQSEDRCHRTGQTKSVTYVDLVIDLHVDKLVQAALASKGSMAKYVSDRLVSGNNIDE